MRIMVEVTATALNVRSGPGESYKVNKTFPKGQWATIDKSSGIWYHLEDGTGWISSNYVKTIKNLDEAQTPSKTNTTSKPTTTATANTTSVSQGLDSSVIELLFKEVQNRQASLNVSTRLFGAPHQFTKETDFRLGTNDYDLGRKYMESIVAESPIVYLMPGKPNYLPDVSADQRDGIKAFLLGKDSDKETKSVIDAILGNKDTKYFRFLSDYSTYMRYVNLLCRTCAIFIGVGDKTAPNTTTPYKKYDWANYRYDNNYKQTPEVKNSIFDLSEIKDDMYRSLFGNYEYSQFYVEPNLSFNESNNNTTAQSKLAGIFDSAQGVVKELSFLTGAAAVDSLQSAQGTFAQGMNQISEKLQGGGNGNFFSRLLGMSSKVMDGSNLVFPEIWGDAAYNKSYNFSINLVSPYGDKESIFLNIIVPMMHLLAMTLPRQTSANSYATPFLVRAFSKGWFSCEMGIIDSISIEKGGQGSWSIDGLPTEVKIQISVKDLYSSMMITNSSNPGLFFENTGLIEFLAVTCGIDTTKPTFGTKLDAMFQTLLNSLTDIDDNIARDFIQGLRNKLSGLWRF